MSTHPSEAMQALGIAFLKVSKLISEAEARGDAKGADAWLVARDAIDAAERAFNEARQKQDWGKRN